MKLPLKLSKRNKNSHKGNFGHIFILAGSLGMSGAAVLAAGAAVAALRSGAGLVTVGLPKSLLPIVAGFQPELMMLPLTENKNGSLSKQASNLINKFLKKVDLLLIGPGLSGNVQTKQLVRKLIIDAKKKMVVDADGLNALVGHVKRLKKAASKNEMIFTPHAGELARLVGSSAKEIQKNRSKFAKQFAKTHKVVTVLKGYKTVVASPEGKLYINNTGNSGMSTAGSGDVLSGIITAFFAQGLNSFDAAKYGVYIHGKAGDLAVSEKTQLGLVASDIIEYLPQALKRSL